MRPGTIVRLKQRKPRRPKVPVRVGDTWILLGPATQVVIMALCPRPTAQKPDSKAVTLSDGRTISEATLRYSYMRLREYHEVFLPALGEKLRAEFCAPPANVIPLRAAAR